MNEKYLRLIIFIITAALHLIVIFFLVFNTGTIVQSTEENAKVMKLTDLAELPPPPAEDPEIPQVEEIAEEMIETDIPPVQNVVAAGSLNVTFEDYFRMDQVSVMPIFDLKNITADLIYPPIALRSGIEGRVILELFVDRAGFVQKITIMREEPEGKGFGESAIKAFTGRKGTPAFANGEPVSCRYRCPVVFRIK